jgi:hypothetical protein
VNWVNAPDQPCFGADPGAPPRPITLDFDPSLIPVHGHDIGTGQTHVREFNAHRVAGRHFVLRDAALQQLGTGVEVGGQGSHFPYHFGVLPGRPLGIAHFTESQPAKQR